MMYQTGKASVYNKDISFSCYFASWDWIGSSILEEKVLSKYILYIIFPINKVYYLFFLSVQGLKAIWKKLSIVNVVNPLITMSISMKTGQLICRTNFQIFLYDGNIMHYTTSRHWSLTEGFLMFSADLERELWHEMG